MHARGKRKGGIAYSALNTSKSLRALGKKVETFARARGKRKGEIAYSALNTSKSLRALEKKVGTFAGAGVKERAKSLILLSTPRNLRTRWKRKCEM